MNKYYHRESDGSIRIDGVAELNNDELILWLADKLASTGDKLEAYVNTGFSVEEVKRIDRDFNKVCYNLNQANKELQAYKDAEEQGLLLRLPCKAGDTAYIIEQCHNIPEQLDGTMYSTDGSPGTATGWYCPYEDNCPFTDITDDCDKVRFDDAVFEDVIKQIIIDEDYTALIFENCNSRNMNDIGKTVFLTREAAEAALKGSEGE